MSGFTITSRKIESFGQDATVPELPGCRAALERSEEVVRSVDERLRADQMDEVSAIALLRSGGR